ncbi:type II toxin-antitoxin system VapC family toxin [Pseudanabaenaceae cyanobacterium LEGE 13415]|nr:type II toxin-antitoxin system VapC family toxin [Pseudanabaenaceae cyanobacterium LEGE 13415]
MTVYFLDSSALVKRYIPEMGTFWIRQLCDPNHQNNLFIARITWVEVLSALARRQREGFITSSNVTQIISIFATHLTQQYRVLEIDRTLADLAGNLVTQYSLRAYDAVQLAAALKLKATLNQAQLPDPVFLTADQRLLAIAQSAGLPCDNPNQHP